MLLLLLHSTSLNTTLPLIGKMLESRPEDALVTLVKTEETVEIVQTVEPVETVETVV